MRTGRLLLRQQVGAAGRELRQRRRRDADAAYYTDSTAQVMYVLPLGHGGRLGTVRTVPLTGDIVYGAGFNANGIVASPDGRTLVLVQSNTGLLFRVSARTGVTTARRAGGFSLTNGDGLLRRGNTLYVMRNQNNQLVQATLSHDFTRARVSARSPTRTSTRPTTIAVLRAVHLRGERTADDSADPGHHVHGRAGARDAERPGGACASGSGRLADRAHVEVGHPQGRHRGAGEVVAPLARQAALGRPGLGDAGRAGRPATRSSGSCSPRR